MYHRWGFGDGSEIGRRHESDCGRAAGLRSEPGLCSHSRRLSVLGSSVVELCVRIEESWKYGVMHFGVDICIHFHNVFPLESSI